MSLAQAVVDVKAQQGRDLMARLNADLHDDVTRLRDRLAQIDCAMRMQAIPIEYYASSHAYTRAALDSLTHAADQIGAVTLTTEEVKQFEEASHRG